MVSENCYFRGCLIPCHFKKIKRMAYYLMLGKILLEAGPMSLVTSTVPMNINIAPLGSEMDLVFLNFN
jgi:hypothetical protein